MRGCLLFKGFLRVKQLPDLIKRRMIINSLQRKNIDETSFWKGDIRINLLQGGKFKSQGGFCGGEFKWNSTLKNGGIMG